MYSLMVCDDEQIVIESVKHIIENEFSNIQIIETARSGKEAIEKTMRIRPDIILMDIRMPGINGLDALKEIKKTNKDVKIVIVSVYEYFEYAKQAVELGVSEYLIKPVKKERIVDTLKRIESQLDDERRKYNWELEAKERIEKMLTVVEHSFIFSLLLSQAQNTDIGKYKKDFFDIKNDKGFIFVLRFKRRGENGSNKMQLGENLDSQRFYNFFKDNLKYRCKCIVGPVMLDRVVVYVAQSSEDLYQQRVQAIGIIENIVHMLEEKYDIEFKVGIGGIQRDQDIMISYQEALKALNRSDGGEIVHIDDIAPNIYNTEFEISAEERRLINGLENGDVQRCITVLTDIFQKHANYFEQENLHYRFIEMMVAAHRVAMENGVNDDTEYGQYIKEILNCNSKDEFERVCTEKIRHIASMVNIKKKNNIGDIVKKANLIIYERFNQELTLDDISKELYISPQYFSRLYKDETGENFIEKLTSVRIDNAKKLMKESEYSIKEICYMSGYCDPNYFSRLFKKHEGISPSAYQKQV
jgi:two-component system, response regulator YesN